MTEISAKEAYDVTHRTTPSEELRGLKGLWQYLITRSQLKAKIQIEQERSRAYAEHRDLLPDNAEVMDYEDNQGRWFWIRKNESPDARLDPQPLLVALSQVRSMPVAELPRPIDGEPTGLTTS
jgi:hypothetical protein